MKYKLCKSLEILRAQINEKFPNRARQSDGWIGDARHARSNSDHNPWLKDAKGIATVTALDITHDKTKGVNCENLLQVLLKNKDRRIKYIIFQRKIYNVKDNFKRRDYNGVNAHNHHLHLSVSTAPSLFDSNEKWKLD